MKPIQRSLDLGKNYFQIPIVVLGGVMLIWSIILSIVHTTHVLFTFWSIGYVLTLILIELPVHEKIHEYWAKKFGVWESTDLRFSLLNKLYKIQTNRPNGKRPSSPHVAIQGQLKPIPFALYVLSPMLFL